MTTTEEICSRYIGLEFKKKGNKLWSLCPIHLEDTASFCLYPNDDNSFGKVYCHGCRFSGDGMHVVAAVNKIPLNDAIQMIAADYGVLQGSKDVDIKREISKKIIKESRQRELVDTYRQQVEDCYIYLVGKYWKTVAIERSVKSIFDLDRYDVAAAFELQPIINGMLDLLASEDLEEQFEGLQWAGRVGLWEEPV